MATRSSKTKTQDQTPSIPGELELNLPELTTLVAETAKARGKDLWKEEAMAFVKHYNKKTELQLDLDAVKEGGAFFHEFNGQRKKIRAQLDAHAAARRAARTP